MSCRNYNFTINVKLDDAHYISGPAKCLALSGSILRDSDPYDEIEKGNLVSPLVFNHNDHNVKIPNDKKPLTPGFNYEEYRQYLVTYWYPETNLYITYDSRLKYIRQIVETCISHSDDYILYCFPYHNDYYPAYIEMTEHGYQSALICANYREDNDDGNGNNDNDSNNDNDGSDDSEFSCDDTSTVADIKYYTRDASGYTIEHIDKNNPLFETGYEVGDILPTSHELFMKYIIEPNIVSTINDMYT